MWPNLALLIVLATTPPTEPEWRKPVFLNSADDQGCCSIQKIKGTKIWDCHRDTRRSCAQTVKELGLEREYSRWNFYKDKSCADVPDCR